MSTLPFSDPVGIELPFERQRRVAVAVTLYGRKPNGAAWQLRVVDAHLDTSFALTRGGPASARRRQAGALADALGSLDAGPPAAPPSLPIPTALGGDFNTWFGDQEPAIQDLRRVFPQTSFVVEPTWAGPLGTRAAIDRIFLRLPGAGSPQTVRLPERFGSDHHPLLTTIAF